jgi:hypothetical protein
MALEASADLSIFPWRGPGNLHLVNWGQHRLAAATIAVTGCHTAVCQNKLAVTANPVQALCFSQGIVFQAAPFSQGVDATNANSLPQIAASVKACNPCCIGCCGVLKVKQVLR